MRQYRFKLEKLLRLRKHVEEVQRMETMRQEGVVREAMGQRDSLVKAVGNVRDELIPEQGEQWKAGEQHAWYRYLVRLSQETFVAEKELLAKREDLLRKRQTLVERSRERKTLDRLEEKKHGQWKEEVNREEQIMLDEIGLIQKSRRGREGRILVTGLLLLICLGMSAGCYLVWRSWLTKGDVGSNIIRLPFDRLAEKKVQQDLAAYENQQRVAREKREAKMAEEPKVETVIASSDEEEGYKKTVQRILQREEALRAKEESLDSQEATLLAAQEDLKREISRLNNVQKRIGDELDQLKALEERRKAEMSAERKAKLDELNKAVKAMTPKRAAELMFAVAFPSTAITVPAPVPVGPDLEGLDLVVKVMSDMSTKDRGEVLDAMTKSSPEQTAVIFDRLDNIRTGMEEDRFYENKAGANALNAKLP
jgi:flagellar protein FliJ